MDLTTRYLGLQLRNPLVASAGPFARTVSGVDRLADAGVGAIVLSSLFEEQFEPGGAKPGGQERDPAGYLGLISRCAEKVDVPVIPSLNGSTTGGWTSYAAAMQEAGAPAIELNLYLPQADPLVSGHEIERRHIEVLTTVKAAVDIPVAVKITPFLSSPGELALRLDRVGADGLVLFNRFMQTAIDPETLQVAVGFELSRPAEAAYVRAWIARLRGRVAASLAASTGVEQAGDVAAYLLAGADVVMTTSALLRHGPEHAEKLLYGLTGWMRRKGFDDLGEVRGRLAEPLAKRAAELRGHGGGDRDGYLDALEHATAKYAAGVDGV